MNTTIVNMEVFSVLVATMIAMTEPRNVYAGSCYTTARTVLE